MMPDKIYNTEIKQVSHSAHHLTGEKICNLDYLKNISRGNELLLEKFIQLFLEQTSTELNALKSAISQLNYSAIAGIVHKLKSCFATMGISRIEWVLIEMERLGSVTNDIERIRSLSKNVNEVFCLAKTELNQERLNYIITKPPQIEIV